MEEQRIKSLEDEFKVLKNQIRAVLLDIKEQLATGGGNGQSGSPPWAGSEPIAQKPGKDAKVFTPEAAEEQEAAPSSAFGSAMGDIVGAKFGTAVNTEKEGQVDLLTVSVLAQWLSRAAATISKEQILKLVEIYDITGNLPSRLKQAILLLADLYCDGSLAEVAEDVPATVSIQLLIELDSLLRYRTGALESVVLSMLLDKKTGR
jgi:hypothetical protein